MITTEALPIGDDPATRIAAEVFGIPYLFPWQRLIIAAVLDAAAPLPGCSEAPEPLRRIAVLPTGAGKSLCWMLPALMIEGITVTVFPLLALMADQERRLREAGVPAVLLRGGLTGDERRKVWDTLERGEAEIVLVNPEVLQVPETARRLTALKPRFLVVDETHTVSQWGESFRPACAAIGRFTEEWNPAAVLALTATAGPLIRERISALLFNGEPPTEALADPDRPAVRYGVLPSLSPMHTLERLVRTESRPAIVFGPTRSSVQRAARILRRRLGGDNIRFYHAGLSRDEKRRLEEWFFSSTDGVLCATCAYGLGVDKPDIRTVIHLAPPSSVEAYLQESGRASRDGKGAKAWLIWAAHEGMNSLGDPGAGPQGGSEGGASSGKAAPKGDSGGPGAGPQGGSEGGASNGKAAPQGDSGGPGAGPQGGSQGGASNRKAALKGDSGGPEAGPQGGSEGGASSGGAASEGDSGGPGAGPQGGSEGGASNGKAAPEGDSGGPGAGPQGGSGRGASSGEAALKGDSGGPEALARARRAAMLRYAASTTRCRREMLLEALGIEARDCSGCDICGGDPWKQPPETEIILNVLRRNPRRFRKGSLARILIGRRSVEIRRSGLDLSRLFGALQGWQLEDAEEAVAALIREGRIAYRGFGKYRALGVSGGFQFRPFAAISPRRDEHLASARGI